MQLELTDEEAAALLALLNRTIENDRYPRAAVAREAGGIEFLGAGQRSNRRRTGDPPAAVGVIWPGLFGGG